MVGMARIEAQNNNDKGGLEWLARAKAADPAALPPDFLRRITNWRSGSGTFRMNVALSELPDFACLPGKAHLRGQPRPKRLFAIRGQVSSPLAPPPGCAFEPRCDQALPACREAMPSLLDIHQARQARCIPIVATKSTSVAATAGYVSGRSLW